MFLSSRQRLKPYFCSRRNDMLLNHLLNLSVVAVAYIVASVDS